MEKIQNYCTVKDCVFTDEETGEEIAYRRVMWHIGNTTLELAPTKNAKGALQVLVDLGIVSVEKEV